MSLSILSCLTARPWLLAAAIMAFGSSAHAQTQTQAQPRDNQKSCQASTSSANGNAKDANLDGTYSACSLADGFISGSTRANDGKQKTPDFTGVVSDQELRKFDSADSTHRLAIKASSGNDAVISGGKILAADDNQFRFRTRDFVAAEEVYPLDETAAYGAAGRALNRSRSGSADNQAPLLVASSLSENLPTTTGDSSGVGGGGAAGGLNTSGGLVPTTPAVPAVPEPETWAMLLAGLGLVAFAGRRKLAKTA
ncbi:PEPxxWA-CTERM sorting domain-containing protein [Janthinobacterium sp. RB2R34]|uniref:PEPxxWA-CTERM sorting domain-containing protein n=1 Tax=Janthinobacterium sp. RB2R34 TaxID=3424193 RepID=UPI003F29429A